jgi:hypothetical protein
MCPDRASAMPDEQLQPTPDLNAALRAFVAAQRG